MSGTIELARHLSNDSKDKDIIKTQFASADVSSYFKFFFDGLTGSDAGLRIKQRNTSTDSIWGRDIWGTMTWDGSFDNELITVRVIQPNRVYSDNLNDSFWADTGSSTATWP